MRFLWGFSLPFQIAGRMRAQAPVECENWRRVAQAQAAVTLLLGAVVVALFVSLRALVLDWAATTGEVRVDGLDDWKEIAVNYALATSPSTDYHHEMARHVALLRSVNLGIHNKVSMSGLRDMMQLLGLSGGKTLLMTGNMVFEARKSAAVLETLLECETALRLALKTDIHVRSASEWPVLVSENPFPEAARDNPTFLTATVLRSAPSKPAVAALQKAIKGDERVAVVGRTAYVVWPNGQGRSKLTLPIIERHLGTRGTTRNWNTVLRVAEALA